MMKINQTDKCKYWEKNIINWGKFYDEGSEEQIEGSKIFTYLYKKLIFPIEKKYMLDRYNIVIKFIKQNANGDKKIAEVGCGVGIFTKEILKSKSYVYAIDYSKVALEATKRTVSDLSNEQLKKIDYLIIDVAVDPIPNCDIAICIGVTPYITNIEAFFKNILPHVDNLLCSYVSNTNLINRIRTLFPVLNIRNLVFVNPEKISNYYEMYGFELVERISLATGFVDNVKRISR